VTGASGFIGQVLVPVLEQAGWQVRQATRRPEALAGDDIVGIPGLSGETHWARALKNCRAVVHGAGKAHAPGRNSTEAEREFFSVNAEATRRLAEHAVAAGVKRFVFISSAKVHGEGRTQPYSEDDTPDPQDSYARSKWQAEQYLAEIAANSEMKIVILRPVLVYGRGVKANFLALMGWIEKGKPMPFGRVKNRRSILFVGNLADAVRVSLEHRSAEGRTFLVSDGEDFSTQSLSRRIAGAMGVEIRIMDVPPRLMQVGGRLVGRGKDIERLTGSFVVDSTSIRETLSWRPPFSANDGLAITASWFRGAQRKG
jgi:nucleoside-diphosphate-sugar epimerase